MKPYVLCHPWKYFPQAETSSEKWILDDLHGNRVAYIYFDNDTQDYLYRAATKSKAVFGHIKDPQHAMDKIERNIRIKIVSDRLKTLL